MTYSKLHFHDRFLASDVCLHGGRRDIPGWSAAGRACFINTGRIPALKKVYTLRYSTALTLSFFFVVLGEAAAGAILEPSPSRAAS